MVIKSENGRYLSALGGVWHWTRCQSRAYECGSLEEAYDLAADHGGFVVHLV